MSVKQNYIDRIKRSFERTPFAEWLKEEGVAVVEGFAVEDVRDLELKPWQRIGANACFINCYSFMEACNGVYVAEIPPGGKLEPERWFCQKIILIEEGSTGTTEIWQEGDSRKHVFEWGKGSVFAIPINAWHRMYNLGPKPAKFLALTKAPLMMKGLSSTQVIFDCTHPMRELYSVADSHFFDGTINRTGRNNGIWETNFIRDAWEVGLDDSGKAYEGQLSGFRMANGTFGGHIAEWDVGRYHQAHYHDSGRLVHPLKSEGFAMCWPAELGSRPFEAGHGEDVVIEPFKAGGIYAPPGNWYHAHFNTGREPARHLAFYGRSGFEDLTPGRADIAMTSLISYPDEDPEVRRIYREALDKQGIPFNMPDSIFRPGASSPM